MPRDLMCVRVCVTFYTAYIRERFIFAGLLYKYVIVVEHMMLILLLLCVH